jgi:hypothetical protein
MRPWPFSARARLFTSPALFLEPPEADLLPFVEEARRLRWTAMWMIFLGCLGMKGRPAVYSGCAGFSSAQKVKESVRTSET